MNSLIMIAWLLFLAQPQKQSALEKQLLFEKRSVAEAQWIPASELEAGLPKLSFADWFAKVVGPGTGVAWQLSDCGDYRLASPTDIPACAETSAVLPDGRLVVVKIIVGTFKKGRFGPPAFCFGVIEQKGELYMVHRLSDLPKMLWTPGILTPPPAIKLPEIKAPAPHALVAVALANKLYMTSEWSGEGLGKLTTIAEESTTVTPPGVGAPLSMKASSAADKVVQGAVTLKAKPIYPPNAKRFNTSGSVEVLVTISDTGRVTNAEALSGHPLLRDAAIDAARKWVFKPTVVNGVPTGTQLVLTFDFTAPK